MDKRDSLPVGVKDQEDDLKLFLEKEREQRRATKHRSAIIAPDDERCLSRRFASFRIRDQEESINILVIGRERSGKSSFISGALHCPDFRYFVKKRFEVSTTVSSDSKMSKLASLKPFRVQFTEISYESLLNDHNLATLKDGTFWAVVWTTDLSRLAARGGLKEELNHIKKVLDEPLEEFGIRGVLICCTKKRDLFKVSEVRPDTITADLCSELVLEFYNKVDEWRDSIGRVIHVACPFPNNPPDLDSPEFVRNTQRSLRNFFIEEGIDVIPWGAHIKIAKQRAFPRKVGVLFAGTSEALIRTVTETTTSIPKVSTSALSKVSEADDDKENKSKEDGEKSKEKKPVKTPQVVLALEPRKQYYLSKMQNWHPALKIEISKEKMTNFHYNLFKANDTQWSDDLPQFLESYELLYKESKLDHLILMIAIEDSSDSSKSVIKRALSRIYTSLKQDPTVLLFFTGAAADKLKPDKPAAEFGIYYHRQNVTNTIHVHRGVANVETLNSALFWAIHKHLRKMCGVDPQSSEELQPFAKSESVLRFGKAYSIDVVTHDF